MGGNDFLEGGGGNATLLGRGWGQEVISRIRLLCNIYLKEFFKLSQVLLTSIAFASLMLKMSNYSGLPPSP